MRENDKYWLWRILTPLLSIVPAGGFVLWTSYQARHSNGWEGLVYFVTFLLFGPAAIVSIPLLWVGIHNLIARFVVFKERKWKAHPRAFYVLLVIEILVILVPVGIAAFAR